MVRVQQESQPRYVGRGGNKDIAKSCQEEKERSCFSFWGVGGGRWGLFWVFFCIRGWWKCVFTEG